MPGSERNGFVVEEQLGPAAPGHDFAAHTPELADTDDPRLVSPAAREQRARGRVVDDAAVAHEQAALLDGNDLAEGSYAVLQRHGFCGILACKPDGSPFGRGDERIDRKFAA